MLALHYNKEVIEAGVDEAGRGCLAGPVVAAAVILPPQIQFDWYDALNDSKKLPETMRDNLRVLIEKESLAWSVAMVDATEIDRINILNATYKAMHLAISGLKIQPELLLIDGNRFKKYKTTEHKTIVKGDGLYLSIAAASILAKTHRDELMKKLHAEFPQYAWDRNKAYGTEVHVKAIMQYGLTPYHRKSFQLKDQQLELF
ncbi:MAG: ribonuclease HII [Bacteroidota bacterium]